MHLINQFRGAQYRRPKAGETTRPLTSRRPTPRRLRVHLRPSFPSLPQRWETSPRVTFPASSPPTIVEAGLASWYGKKHQGKRTASGEVFDQKKFTAAHRSLPWGSIVKLTNLANGKSVEVRINDRGPFEKGRIIDVSRAAASVLGMVESGVARVQLELLSPLESSDDLVLRNRQ